MDVFRRRDFFWQCFRRGDPYLFSFWSFSGIKCLRVVILIGIRRERRVSKASGVDYLTRASGDMQWLHISPDSPLFCSKCHSRLGILRMIRAAFFKRKGMSYKILCIPCGYQNIRIKGAFADDVDRRWTGRGPGS